MVPVRSKPENYGFSSKQKRTDQSSKRAVVSKRSSNFREQWRADRKKINEALSHFRKLLGDKKLLAELSPEYERKRSGIGVHMRAVRVLEKLGKWVDGGKQQGFVSGIEVGDEFHWRAELRIAGLHHEFQKGIDYFKGINGKPLAVSIVDSGRYDNVGGISSEITYCGEGQNHLDRGGGKPKDQKLTGGNLALKNSMDCKTPVRVIRRIDSRQSCSAKDAINSNDCGYKFVYIGLYRVVDFLTEKGPFGKEIFKFKLRKMEGRQEELD